MKALFLPAMVLSNRLSYRRKFIFFGALFALPLLVLVWLLWRSMQADIVVMQREQAGLRWQQPMLDLLYHSANLQAATQARLAGDPAWNDIHRHATAGSEKAMKQLAALQAQEGSRLDIAAEYQTLQQEWQHTLTPASDADSALDTHAALHSAVLALQSQIGDTSGLSLDNDLATAYMLDTATSKLPALLQRLSAAREAGILVLGKKSLRGQLKTELMTTRGALPSLLDWTQQNFGKVWRAEVSSKQVLEPRMNQLLDDSLVIQELLTTKIIDASDYDMSRADYFNRTTPALTAGWHLSHALLPEIERRLDRRIDQLRTQQSLALSLMLLVGLVVSYFFIGSYIGIIRAIKSLAHGANELATGNLHVRVKLYARDELLQVADSFNHMADAMSSLIRSVQHAVDEVRTAAGEVAATGTTVTSAAQRQSHAALQTAAAIEQLTHSIDQVAANSRDTRRETGHAMSRAQTGGNMAVEAARQIQTMASSVEESSRHVLELEQKSIEISTAVTTIQGIAKQTNLLALNAAIEAARAGESGRGFAIVADEVRKLAENVNQAAVSIGTMIAAIQSDIHHSVTLLSADQVRVVQAVGTIQQLESMMRDTAQQVIMAERLVSNISSATEEQTLASSTIARDMQDISTQSESVSRALKQSQHATHELNQLAVELSDAISGFRL
jgi:methyl-accepting chemotaxis protein